MRELQSPEIKDLVSALVKAQANVRHAFLDAENPHFRSDYATLESVIDAVKPAFLAQGLVIVQQPMVELSGENILITTVAHESGQWMRSFTQILNEKKSCQSMGSGITYARRYALAAIANIGQTDDDGNEATAPIGNPKVEVETSKPNLPNIKPQVNASKPEPLDHDKAVAAAMKFKIEFGRKYNGRIVGDIPQAELEAYVKWLMASAVRDGTALSLQVQTLKAAYERIYGKQEW